MGGTLLLVPLLCLINHVNFYRVHEVQKNLSRPGQIGSGRMDGAGISGVDPMVFIDQGLESVFLCSECAGRIRRADQDAPGLVVEAEDGWHAVPAGRPLG